MARSVEIYGKLEIESEKFGGSDASEWSSYQTNDNRQYYDDHNHFLRSASKSPNHWKAGVQINWKSGK